MEYLKSKALISLFYVLVVLYGMSVLSIFVHNRGKNNDGKIEDFGLKLMKTIDTSDGYLFKEFQDYRLDEVFVVGVTLLGLLANFCYNRGYKFRFVIEWFMLMTVLFLIKTIGMIVTIVPPPENGICKTDYKHDTNGFGMLLDGLEVFVWRDRICYDIFMDGDMINTTILGLLLMRYFPNMGVRVGVVLVWLMNIFVLMMLRGVYSMNMFTTLMVSVLIFLIYHYETMNGLGFFGTMLREPEPEEEEEEVMVFEADEEMPEVVPENTEDEAHDEVELDIVEDRGSSVEVEVGSNVAMEEMKMEEEEVVVNVD